MTFYAYREGRNYLIYCVTGDCDYAMYSSAEWSARYAKNEHDRKHHHHCKVKDVSGRKLDRDRPPYMVRRRRLWENVHEVKLSRMSLWERVKYEVRKRLR